MPTPASAPAPPPDAVAIVGVDCRFPGAPDTGAYWDLLMRAGDGVGEVPEQRWDAREFHTDRAGPEGSSNTTQGGFMADPDAFDNEFFTISPREAAAMDPQQRLLLQSAWRAVEDAGLAPHALAGSRTGVFVGIMGNEWAQLHLTDYARVTAQAGSGNGYCMTANRISYHLDLKGPSLAVDTACSSSLVAVHLAGNALLSGECDTALASGVNVALTPALSIFYTQAGLSAPDGRCKPFAAGANGIGRGEGVGTVMLRRLSDARADGQRIYAVVRGTAVNQDGRSNGITAPSRWAQQDVLEAAYRRAGCDPADVVFTEAHGTGTVLGDMMEVKALGHHHRGRRRPMAIGSVKGNLGHAEGAAGIAGLIKVALALHHRTVPASRFAAKENPQLKLREHGLRLLKAPLRLSGHALAGLSSFGLGGTNAHAVLESAPAVRTATGGGSGEGEDGERDATGIGCGVFTLTAPHAEAVARNLRAQADALAARRQPAGPLCWTSNHVKAGHQLRFAVPAADSAELAATLREAAATPDALARLTGAPAAPPRLAFLHTGQGSQYPGMTARLHRESPLYRRFLDEADDALLPHTGRSVRDQLLGGDDEVHLTAYAQPALFAVGYALGRTLAELGAEPALLLGHSVGEFSAACLAGALTLDGAARLIAARGRLMQQLPDGGGMLAVLAGPDALRDRVADEPLVDLAVLNGPRACVLSGDLAALGRIERELTGTGVRVRRLQVSHAFHSPLMEPMLEPFAREAEKAGGGAPRTPFWSTLRGRLLAEGEELDAAYWVEHVRAPVLFADAAAGLLAEGPSHLVEIGPKPVLVGMTGHLGGPARAIRPASVLPLKDEESGARELAEAVAALYRGGVEPRWEAVYPARERTPLPLAPYAFSDTHRYWTSGPVRRDATAPPAPAAPAPVAEAAPAAQESPAAAGVLTLDRPPETGDPVAAVVYETVARVGGYAVEDLSPSLRLYEDLGFDSVMIMELKTRLEERLSGISALTVQDLLPRLATPGDLAGFLGAYLGGTPGGEEKTA
ncbi:type I polyketide synthase [Streptomyces albiaxialis]|uniref:Type I polyketide synthase n=1 Tax=Streptomyces albiaxialis TaxID=329523 RepID=A0ABN2VYE3_9ACTN